MVCLWILLFISAVIHFLLIASIKKLRKDYKYFKGQRGIDEEYKAWRSLLLRAVFENLMLFLFDALIIYTLII